MGNSGLMGNEAFGMVGCDATFQRRFSPLPNYPAKDALKRSNDVINVAYRRLVKIASRLYRPDEEDLFLLGNFGKVIHK